MIKLRPRISTRDLALNTKRMIKMKVSCLYQMTLRNQRQPSRRASHRALHQATNPDLSAIGIRAVPRRTPNIQRSNIQLNRKPQVGVGRKMGEAIRQAAPERVRPRHPRWIRRRTGTERRRTRLGMQLTKGGILGPSTRLRVPVSNVARAHRVRPNDSGLRF